MTTREPAVGPRGLEPDPAARPAAAVPETPATGMILVVGPPGTDLASLGRALGELGLPALELDPVVDPDVVPVAERVLHELRATAAAPPELDRLESGPDPAAAGAEGALGRLDAVRRRQGAGAANPYVVWVEPSNALLLPLLRRSLAQPLAVILVWRAPETAVEALGAAGVGPAHALALWEGHLVHALRGAAGLPLVGLDLDRTADLAPALTARLAALGIAGAEPVAGAPTAAALERTPDAGADVAPAVGSAPGGSPELAAVAAAMAARLAPVLGAADGSHAAWEPPADVRPGPFTEAILAAHRAAHRAALDAVEAWGAAHAAETAAADALEAVEREHRALVGPDPVAYRELRRELWRLRDEFAGILAGRTNYHVAWMRTDAARLTAEQRAADLLGRLQQMQAELPVLHEARAQRDGMLASRRWWLGGIFTRPFARLRGRTPPS